MSQYGSSIQTAQITTGNVRTTIDPRDTTFPNNKAVNPLGEKYYDNPVLVVGELSGSPVAYRYVRYNSTTNAAWLAEPAPVYWVDAAHTTVTGTFSEGLTATSADIAGYAMPNTTDLSQFTGAQLATAVNGNFIWIQVFGRILGAFAPGSTAVGDLLIGATGNFTSARIANHATQTADTPLAWATTAVSSSKSNQWVVVEY